MMINYGMDKMKFGQAVLSGQSIRLVTTLHSLTNLRGVAKAEIKFAIEIKDQPKKHLKELLCSFIISINGKLLKKQILSPEMIEIRLKKLDTKLLGCASDGSFPGIILSFYSHKSERLCRFKLFRCISMISFTVGDR